MENDPNLDGKYLGTITEDFVKISDILKEAVEQIRSRKISDFPIFPISKGDPALGQVLFKREEKDLHWNFNFAYLELLVEVGIIQPDKMEAFKSTYRGTDEYACILVLDDERPNFVYIPFPEEDY